MSFLGKKKSKKLTRLFFATDIHGSERTYRKFINAGKFYEVNTIVMGGDISGKLLIPIIKEANGNYRATLQGHRPQADDGRRTEAVAGQDRPAGLLLPDHGRGRVQGAGQRPGEGEQAVPRAGAQAPERMGGPGGDTAEGHRHPLLRDRRQRRRSGSAGSDPRRGPGIVLRLRSAGGADRRQPHHGERRLQQSDALEDAARDPG